MFCPDCRKEVETYLDTKTGEINCKECFGLIKIEEKLPPLGICISDGVKMSTK